MWAADAERIGELLADDGWRPLADHDVDGSAGYERDGARLELAFLARDEGGAVYTPLRDGGRAAWAPGAFAADEGRIDDVRARVISLRALREEKSGPRDDPQATAKDRADLARLSGLG